MRRGSCYCISVRDTINYCKEAVRDEFVSVHYCNTALNIADITTKALGGVKYEMFEAQLHGFQPLPVIDIE